jgi:hypothetical protein
MKVEGRKEEKRKHHQSKQKAKQVVCLGVATGDSSNHDYQFRVSGVLNFLNTLSKGLACIVVEAGLTHLGESSG